MAAQYHHITQSGLGKPLRTKIEKKRYMHIVTLKVTKVSQAVANVHDICYYLTETERVSILSALVIQRGMHITQSKDQNSHDCVSIQKSMGNGCIEGKSLFI